MRAFSEGAIDVHVHVDMSTWTDVDMGRGARLEGDHARTEEREGGRRQVTLIERTRREEVEAAEEGLLAASEEESGDETGGAGGRGESMALLQFTTTAASARPGNKGRHMHMFHANKLGEDHNKLHRMNRSDLIQLTEESLNLGIAYGEDTLAAVHKLMKFKKHYCNQCFETCLETHGTAIDSFQKALGALKGNSYDEVNGCVAGAWALC
ncbi:hypothetical protein Scep_023820 [Stephania cephalantha]|uniref:Uncharacterized protein n=1 Tax=Stephania cephalantha TaxID=152367 RepID=A0AAP0EVD0_9MAGN